MIVLDASAALELLLRSPKADAVEELLFHSEAGALCAPHLIDVEVVQVLRRLSGSGNITAARAAQALEDLGSMPLTRFPHDALTPRMWTLRKNLTAYDAVYVALAESLPATLVTCDRKLAAAPGNRARISLV